MNYVTNYILQQNYPIIPESNEFVLITYKGFAENCIDIRFNLSFAKESDGAIQHFSVDLNENAWSNPHLPIDGKYTINSFIASCGHLKINFPETNFTPIFADKDDVPSMHILLTIDVDDEQIGIIDIGDHLDPWDKSDDGRPIMKYVLCMQKSEIRN